MTVEQAIAKAERILPGRTAPEGQRDPRWQAIIKVGEFVRSDPEPIWAFILKWGRHPNSDLRMAISVCLLERLLGCHFDLIFPRVEVEVRKSRRFADTFSHCWTMGQSEIPANTKRMDRLKKTLSRGESGSARRTKCSIRRL